MPDKKQINNLNYMSKNKQPAPPKENPQNIPVDELMTATGVPENAFRELSENEEYVPVMHPVKPQQEVTLSSVPPPLTWA